MFCYVFVLVVCLTDFVSFASVVMIGTIPLVFAAWCWLHCKPGRDTPVFVCLYKYDNCDSFMSFVDFSCLIDVDDV